MLRQIDQNAVGPSHDLTREHPMLQGVFGAFNANLSVYGPLVVPAVMRRGCLGQDPLGV